MPTALEEVRFERVSFAYPGSAPVLREFSLRLPGCGTVCLSGPSGCGKTTLLRLLAGLEIPQEGTVYGLAGRRVSMVFQENRLLPWMSAEENAALGDPSPAGRERAALWLERLGLGGIRSCRPEELSGGMKRRVALARALAAEGNLLLLDEPFTGLDAFSWERAASWIAEASASRLTVLVTHVAEQARRLGAAEVSLTGPPLRCAGNSAKFLDESERGGYNKNGL